MIDEFPMFPFRRRPTRVLRYRIRRTSLSEEMDTRIVTSAPTREAAEAALLHHSREGYKLDV